LARINAVAAVRDSGACPATCGVTTTLSRAFREWAHPRALPRADQGPPRVFPLAQMARSWEGMAALTRPSHQ
jgi:hypothetical protein